MKYTVVVPANQATRREFNNLRKAKAYLRTLPRGLTYHCGHLFDNVPGRRLTVNEDGNYNYLHCPKSWRN